MAGVLNFSNYIGGADNIQIEQIFPSTQKTLVYNYGQNITGWTFYIDHQTVVVDALAFDRNTGEPNFANSAIIGTFSTGTVSTSTYVNVVSASSGTVAITFPKAMYSGPILPDARSHTPITVVGVSWTDASTPAQTNTHRWAFIQSWEPGVAAGDPVLANGYTAITVGA
jgi:hypothetical protein